MKDLAAHRKQFHMLIQRLATFLSKIEPGHIFICHIRVVDAVVATPQGQHGPNSGN
jgi:hypothetical protein